MYLICDKHEHNYSLLLHEGAPDETVCYHVEELFWPLALLSVLLSLLDVCPGCTHLKYTTPDIQNHGPTTKLRNPVTLFLTHLAVQSDSHEHSNVDSCAPSIPKWGPAGQGAFILLFFPLTGEPWCRLSPNKFFHSSISNETFSLLLHRARTSCVVFNTHIQLEHLSDDQLQDVLSDGWDVHRHPQEVVDITLL